jgi:Leucine-rich repeat (LRR) protein
VSKLRIWIYLSGMMALMLIMGLLTMAGTPGLVQADGDPLVIFPDPNLEAAIREAINKPTGDIYQSDLEELTEFSAEIRHIVNLTGLGHCTSLTSLDLRHNRISDISPLANLTSLVELYIADNQISDVSPLAGLTSLTVLNLVANQISDISPAANLTNLIELNLCNNNISDISSLASLTNLIELNLAANQIRDISPLDNLTNLTVLRLDFNWISDIYPLASLTSLAELTLLENSISDISPLASITSLTSLDLHDNQISNISPLANLISLTSLDLWGNNISDISPLVNLTSLTELSLGSNNISDIKPLVDNHGLREGDYVNLRFNPLSDTSLNTYIPQLQARGVIVDYRYPSWCFIATAAYGTPMAEEIEILREFRDEYLLTNPLGQALVDLYYRVSPPMAEFITEHPALKPIVRAGLVPAVAISAIAVNTTPAEKITILGLLVLVLAALAVWATRRRGRGPEHTSG